MSYPSGHREQRWEQRVNTQLPIQINIGTQISLQGYLQDISLKGALVKIKNSVFIESNDEIGFIIGDQTKGEENLVEGKACVSRIIPGEGFAIYFTKLDEKALDCLKKVATKLT